MNVIPTFDLNLKEQALQLESNCFKLIRKNVISCTVVNNAYRIRLDETRCFKSWSCNWSKFVKLAICRHEIAYSNFNLLDWHGSQYRQPLKFVNKLKKGAIPKKRLTRKREKALVHE